MISEHSDSQVGPTLGGYSSRNKRSLSIANSSQTYKKARNRRGSLKIIVNMPEDVIFEIFGWLDPLDLLHVARTTKTLRDVLMSRSSITIWKTARSKFDGLPDCPDDLSEPQYAALIFVERCSVSMLQLLPPSIMLSYVCDLRSVLRQEARHCSYLVVCAAQML
ncbi:hypothetical protein BDN70DRAFT_815289 [Pholiota conissans]|uniref:F-box domain-containing protein n=1 Tax=Pholiota conissans TaxID=109636 RepID=A0A9P5YRT4_9AGAR|nr:hypothetical protein BDN70DRAFT_815289 [Pholiota conissans]